MKATCWKGPNTVQVEEVPDPQILNAQRRDREDHLDRDLRLGSAPAAGLRAGHDAG